MDPSVGVIGTGNMGTPVARRLLEAGHLRAAFDLDRARAEAAVGEELVAPSAQDLAEQVSVVLTILPSGPAIEDLILGPGGLFGGWTAGRILLDMSTTAPSLSRMLAEAITAVGGRYCEAPLSGGTAAAKEGTLTVIGAGDEETFEEVRPILRCVGTAIHFVGGPGAGQTLKIANNLLLAVQTVAVGEAWALVRRSGIDPRVAHRVLTECSGDSRQLRLRVPEPGLVPHAPPSDGYRPGFTVDLMCKDIGLARDLAAEGSIRTPTLDAARDQYAVAVERGAGKRDISIVGETLELAGG